MCRSRRELSNEYLLAKIGVDTAENEPCKVCPLSAYRSPRYGLGDGHTSPGLPGSHPEEAAGVAPGGELKPNDANESESNVLGNVLAAYPKLDQFFR